MRRSGLPGHADAAGVERLALEVELVEQRRIAHRCLRIADQHGGAGGRALAAHDPGMAELRTLRRRRRRADPARARGHTLDAVRSIRRHMSRPLDDCRGVVGRQRFQVAGGGGQRSTAAAPPSRAVRLRRGPACGPRSSVAARHQVPRAVGGEELAQVPPRSQAVGGCPRLRFESQPCEQRMQMLAVLAK